VKTYYDARAPEYDEWYLGTGRFAQRHRPGWDDAVRELVDAVAALPPGQTLDVACGTGFLTQHLAGDVTGLDQSEQMLEIARERVPRGKFVRGDALELPFADGAFSRLFTAHFYGHLEGDERRRFLAEARRVARELVVVDSAGEPREELSERILNDGSRWQVYKRRFTGPELAGELGGGEVLLANDWFVMVRA
jgi:ubiquinone/menaquinone biosynthesis C-methylase UbiE